MRPWLRASALLALAFAPLLAASQQLTVAAAASLSDALREIGARFEAQRPQARLRFSFAASGVLMQQIVNGAPVDLFISADQETLDRGLQHKLLDPSTRRNLASNALVMIAPAAGAPAIARLDDLRAPAVRRIALGKPATVPAGRYTKQALDHERLWTLLEPKFVFADHVRQVLDYVARGEVEAGFVYRTDVAPMKDKVRIVLTAGGHVPIAYPLAVVADSAQPALAREFAAFVLASEAQAILARHGFGPP
jgi:molybdate transport system substrate-binding protein